MSSSTRPSADPDAIEFSPIDTGDLETGSEEAVTIEYRPPAPARGIVGTLKKCLYGGRLQTVTIFLVGVGIYLLVLWLSGEQCYGIADNDDYPQAACITLFILLIFCIIMLTFYVSRVVILFLQLFIACIRRKTTAN